MFIAALRNLVFALFVSSIANCALASVVALQEGTATFSQPSAIDGLDHSPGSSVDGTFNNNNGWAIAATGNGGDDTAEQAVVWETVADVDASALRFELHQLFQSTTFPSLLIGKFRFSVTSDDRALFADGLANSGDVTANWQVLENPTVAGPASMTFSSLLDHSILTGGTVPATGVYTVDYSGVYTGITGIRLEVLEDPSLPFNGPGHAAFDGNFTLTELVVTATPIPEPAAIALALLAVNCLIGIRR